MTIGDGDNTVNVGDYIEGRSTLKTGSGDDIIKIGQSVDSSQNGLWVSNIDAGDGDNIIDIKGKVISTLPTERGYGQITTGSGDDTIKVSGAVEGQNVIINSGDGDDTIDVGSVEKSATIIAGIGSDTINIGSFSSGTLYTGTAEANEDNSVDTVTINKDMSGGDIYLGINDVLEVKGTMSGGSVHFSSSDDTLSVGKLTGGYTVTGGSPRIDMGAGDDTLSVGADSVNRPDFIGG